VEALEDLGRSEAEPTAGPADVITHRPEGIGEEIMPLEIIGAGFGRTGTNSLRLALEHLGFGPCHHMHEVAADPRQVPIWEAAAQGRPMDWESVFAGYRSQVDWPGARYWRELASAFPQARIILTVRPPEDWFRSFAATVAPELLGPPSSPDPVAVARRHMQRETIAQQVFGGRPMDRAHAIAVFRNHIEQVRQSVPAERLLIFEVTQGWDPLCAFLGVRAPDTPFPRTNDAREFHQRTWIRNSCA